MREHLGPATNCSDARDRQKPPKGCAEKRTPEPECHPALAQASCREATHNSQSSCFWRAWRRGGWLRQPNLFALGPGAARVVERRNEVVRAALTRDLDGLLDIGHGFPLAVPAVGHVRQR